jgi:hypothetical protein
MAYSLGDAYRPLRLVLRVNGTVIGLALGGTFMLASESILTRLGLMGTGTPVGLRIAGAALVGVGLFLLYGSGGREIDLSVIIPCMVFHALLAVVLLLAYLGGGLDSMGLVARIGLVVIFVLCLLGTLAPVRYLRAEYRF